MKIVPFLVLIVLLALAAGCTRPAEQPVPTTPSPEVTAGITGEPASAMVTAERFQATKILITYKGGPDADQLIELQTTVITGIGSVNIQSMGSRIDTTPVQGGGTDIFQGPYEGRVHVLTTAFYVNGTHADVLDTWI